MKNLRLAALLALVAALVSISGAVVPAQTPSTHISLVTHSLPVPQEVPFARGRSTHAPVVGSHAVVRHASSDGGHVIGGPALQTPLLQSLARAQALPGSHPSQDPPPQSRSLSLGVFCPSLQVGS